ncbi:MAG: CPBP family intramembrane metalloprotease [Candidatus Bostrichicola ureolyticus]|nr:MAG: CPBP family intramembrane metalloprotease [Candidatus Bostrichicola ureolyticus]
MFKLNYLKSIYLIIKWLCLRLIIIYISSFLIKKNDINILFPIIYGTHFILFFYYLYIKYNLNVKDLLINNLKLSKWYFYPLILIILFLTMILNDYIICIIQYILNIRFDNLNLDFNLNNNFILITIILLAPIFEEILFRGIILNGLIQNKIFYVKAILFSSLLFGLIHMNVLQFIAGFIIGSVIGIIYFSTRSILNCILLHLLNNFIEIFFYKKNIYIHILLYNKYNNWIILFILFLLIFCIYILILKSKNIWINWNK